MITMELTTTASLVTPLGRGAIATVIVAGKAATEIVQRYFRPRGSHGSLVPESKRVRYGTWQHANAAAEEVVVCSTEGDLWEIHCHGGHAAANSILAAVVHAGAHPVSWQEWITFRTPDVLAAEARIALAEARTVRTAAILLDQLRGNLRAELTQIVGSIARGELNVARERVARLISWSNFGQHLTCPWRVTVAGAPNAGKSSLINCLLGFDRSLVYSQPGTTRDVVTASTALEGWPVIFADTAGVRQTSDAVEYEGIERARREMQQADLVVWVTEGPAAVQPPSEICNRMLLVRSKGDLYSAPPAADEPTIWTSAVSGSGVDQLQASIVERLVPRIPGPGEAVPFTRRHAERLLDAQAFLVAGQLTRATQSLRQLCDGPDAL